MAKKKEQVDVEQLREELLICRKMDTTSSPMIG